MLRLPSFKKAPMVIPFINLATISAEVKSVRDTLKKLYADLGGKKNVEDVSILTLKNTIKGQLLKPLDSMIQKVKERTSNFPPEALEFDVMVCHKFCSRHKSETKVVLMMSVETIYIWYLSAVEKLKEDDPLKYPLVRDIASLLSTFGICSDVTHYCEIMNDDLMMEEGEDKEKDKEIKELLKEVELEKNSYLQFIKNRKERYGDTLRRIKKRREEIDGILTKAETEFFDNAIKLFTLWGKHWEEVDFLDDDEQGDRNQLNAFFNLLWSSHGEIAARLDSDIQFEYGNYMPPVMYIAVKDKKSVKKAVEVFETICLLASTIKGGEDLWNS